MDWKHLNERLHQPAGLWPVVVAAVVIVIGLDLSQLWVARRIELEKDAVRATQQSVEGLSQTLERERSLEDLKIRDVAQFKAGFSDLAQSRKTLFEAGLSLQEERRLLEKQLEIMTTYLSVDSGLARVFLNRGEHPLDSYRVLYAPPKAWPEPQVFLDSATVLPSAVFPSTMAATTSGSTTALRPLPGVVRIISKERFAHPERGASEQVNDRLQYNPPQVGTSVRSNALGEFVVFTNSKLILHGPPLNEEAHARYPHYCLGLDLETARKLYRATFIGTKIVIPPAAP